MIDPKALQLIRYIDSEMVSLERIVKRHPEFRNRLSGLSGVLSRAWQIFAPDLSYVDFIELVRNDNEPKTDG